MDRTRKVPITVLIRALGVGTNCLLYTSRGQDLPDRENASAVLSWWEIKEDTQDSEPSAERETIAWESEKNDCKMCIRDRCYALLMLDAGDYNNPKQPELRKKFITELLEYQKESGGFCIDNSLDPEVDITAMAVQALAPYYKEDKCKKEKLDAQKMKESIDAAVKWLAAQESDLSLIHI